MLFRGQCENKKSAYRFVQLILSIFILVSLSSNVSILIDSHVNLLMHQIQTVRIDAAKDQRLNLSEEVRIDQKVRGSINGCNLVSLDRTL